MITVGLIIAAGVAVYFIPYKVGIDINDKGFSPETIVVPKGTTLVFTNTGSNLHWPASDFHPTHTLYPVEGGCIGSKFDACHGLNPGETFEFKLDRVGSWPIHDHLYPELTGEVKVSPDPAWLIRFKSFFPFLGISKTESKEATSMSLPDASEFKNIDYGQQVTLIKQLAIDDPIYAWSYIRKAYTQNGEVVGNAHELAHVVGRGLYNKFGLQGILNCDITFAYGCFHGVTQALMQVEGKDAIEQVETSCTDYFPPDVNHNFSGCIHGMGHGLLTWENLNISSALMDCDILIDSYKNYCYDGVFMEYSMDVPKSSVDMSDPWKFCEDMDVKYQYNCARYQAQTFQLQSNGNIQSIASDCNKTSNETFKATCLDGLGYYITQTSQGDLAQILGSCGNLKNNDYIHCVSGSAREVAFQEYSDWENISSTLCNKLSDPDKTKCMVGKVKPK